jgi:hypothetical protein
MNPTPAVDCKRGAPMGRGWPHLDADLARTVIRMYATHLPQSEVEHQHLKAAEAVLNPTESPKVSLRRVRLDSGGYDNGGAYWGIGKPLYWAGSDCGTVTMYFRATDRHNAKEQVREKHPKARFYR